MKQSVEMGWLTELGFKILNVVTWAKTNPPTFNISCRYFTHSTEFIIWARKSAKITHYYNYSIMKQINSNKQMTDVWQLPAIACWENHVANILLRNPYLYCRVLFWHQLVVVRGFSTHLQAAALQELQPIFLGRRFLGIDREEEYLILSKNRKKEIEQIAIFYIIKRLKIFPFE